MLITQKSNIPEVFRPPSLFPRTVGAHGIHSCARQCISGTGELGAALWLDRGTDASWTNLSLQPQWLQPWCARMRMRLPGTVIVMSEILRHGFEGYLCR